MQRPLTNYLKNTKALPWEEYIPADGRFWVAKAASVKSRLFSPSDIQSIMKKAMVERRRISTIITGLRKMEPIILSEYS